jgi:hypothetical protein
VLFGAYHFRPERPSILTANKPTSYETRIKFYELAQNRLILNINCIKIFSVNTRKEWEPG